MILNQLSKFIKSNSKDKLLYVVGSFFIEFVVTLIITKLISIALSKTDFGEYSLFLSIFALVSVLPFFSLHSSVERSLITKENKNEIIISVFLVFGFFFILYSLVLLFFLIFKNDYSKLLLSVFYVFCASRILKTTIITIININRHNKEAFYLRFFDCIIQLFIVVVCFFDKKLNIEIIFFSSIISSILVIIYSIILLNKIFLLNYSKLFSKKYFTIIKNEILIFSLPLIFWGIFIWIQNMVGRWYIDAMVNRDNVANYSLMTSLALLPVTAIISIFGGFFVPRFYLKENENKGFIARINKKVQIISSIFWIFIILFSYFFGDLLIKIFLSKKYLEVSWTLPFLLFGNAIHCIGQLSIYEIYYYKKPKLLILSNILPGILALSLGFFLIKNYGFFGAIISNVISFTTSGLITLYSTKIFSKKRMYAS